MATLPLIKGFLIIAQYPSYPIRDKFCLPLHFLLLFKKVEIDIYR